MLVLSRRKDETIMIGDEIEITVVDVRGDTVRLGIQAPRSVSVHRKEIYNAIQAENIAAAKEQAPDEQTVGGLGQLLKGGGQGLALSSALGKLAGGSASVNPLSGAAPNNAPNPPPVDGLKKLMPGAKPSVRKKKRQL